MTVKRTSKTTGGSGVPQKMISSEGHDLTVASQNEAPIPLASKAVFWQPRHIAASVNLIHLPFLFWLIETVRPASVVQIGLRDGVSFMGLCQGVDKLGLEAVCMGLRAASDDGAKLSDKLLESHAALYGDFSFIVTEETGRAARHMRSAQVDLLVVDMPVDEAFLTNLQAHWEPLLSDRAVIVLLDQARNFAGKDAEKFYDKLVQSHLSISFPQAESGLDVILFGKRQTERLVHLAQLDLGDPGYLGARNVFTRLGQGLENTQQARSKTALLEKTKAALKDLEARVELLQAEQRPLQDAVRDAQEAEEVQVAENANLLAQIFDMGKELERVRANTAIQEELDVLRSELQSKDGQILELTDQLAQEQQKQKDHLLALETVSAEKTSLEDRLNQLETMRQDSVQKNKALREEKSTFEAQLAQQEARVKLEMEAQKVSHRKEIEKLEEALAQEQKKRKEHWSKVQALDTEKSALRDFLTQAEARNQEAEQSFRILEGEKTRLDSVLAKREAEAQAVLVAERKAQSEELSRLQKAFEKKLQSSQEKRLSLWESFEALKREYQALLRHQKAEASATIEDVSGRCA